MQIQVNGKMENIEPGITISDFLKFKKLDSEKVVVEHNMEIVDRHDFNGIFLKENDSLEVLRFVGGG